jgi:hypothetical protein
MAHSKGQAHAKGHSHGMHGHGGAHTGSAVHNAPTHHMSDHLQNPHNKAHAGHTASMHDDGGMFPMGAG